MLVLEGQPYPLRQAEVLKVNIITEAIKRSTAIFLLTFIFDNYETKLCFNMYINEKIKKKFHNSKNNLILLKKNGRKIQKLV